MRGVNKYEKSIKLSKKIEATPNFKTQMEISRVLDNLLTNAIKFTPDEGDISINLLSTEEKIRFEVSNTGPTIPEEEKDKIFDKFYRRTENKLQSGQGLGLYFCKKTVEKLNGELTVESPLSESRDGVKFTLKLPKN